MKQRIRINENQFNNLVKKIVKESVQKVLKENLSVTYPKSWDDEGTTYSQVIKIGLTQEDLDALNKKLVGMADEYDTPNEDGVINQSPMLNGHEMYSKNLRKTLQFGKNHLTLSQLYALQKLLNWKEYKRVKMDRNTILNIVQI